MKSIHLEIDRKNKWTLFLEANSCFYKVLICKTSTVIFNPQRNVW